MSYIPETDIIFVNALNLSANVGPDRSYLAQVGESDNVHNSVDYGHLSNAVSNAIEANNTFPDIRGLVDMVAENAFSLAGEAAAAVKVVVDLRQMILLAGLFSVEVTIPVSAHGKGALVKTIVKDMVLVTIIGVNPPEREAKQRVIIDIFFTESAGHHFPINYQTIMTQISKEVESSSYLTLEKLVTQMLRIACLAAVGLEIVTVRAQKPSGLTFAHSSGVEITRRRSDFIATV